MIVVILGIKMPPEEFSELVRDHLQSMTLHSPPESIHSIGLESLRKPEITFWSAWEGDELVGCGTLKELDGQHGEIKSMRTSSSHLRKGIAKRVLQYIIEEAKRRHERPKKRIYDKGIMTFVKSA